MISIYYFLATLTVIDGFILAYKLNPKISFLWVLILLAPMFYILLSLGLGTTVITLQKCCILGILVPYYTYLAIRIKKL